MPETFLHTLKRGVKELDISLNKGALNKYLLYYNELKIWSRAYNITGLEDDRDIAVLLFLDSLLYLKALPEYKDNPIRVLDVGSGGGFPGIVLKIAAPGVDLSLIEPSWKRVAFLRHTVKKIQIHDVTIIQSTLEEYAKNEGKRVYDVIVTKALFRVYEFIKKTEKLTAGGSILVLSKGPAYRQELDELYSRLGKRIDRYYIETIPLQLPLLHRERYLVKVTIP